jgi:hypothetical protein
MSANWGTSHDSFWRTCRTYFPEVGEGTLICERPPPSGDLGGAKPTAFMIPDTKRDVAETCPLREGSGRASQPETDFESETQTNHGPLVLMEN